MGDPWQWVSLNFWFLAASGGRLPEQERRKPTFDTRRYKGEGTRAGSMRVNTNSSIWPMATLGKMHVSDCRNNNEIR